MRLKYSAIFSIYSLVAFLWKTMRFCLWLQLLHFSLLPWTFSIFFFCSPFTFALFFVLFTWADLGAATRECSPGRRSGSTLRMACVSKQVCDPQATPEQRALCSGTQFITPPLISVLLLHHCFSLYPLPILSTDPFMYTHTHMCWYLCFVRT